MTEFLPEVDVERALVDTKSRAVFGRRASAGQKTPRRVSMLLAGLGAAAGVIAVVGCLVWFAATFVYRPQPFREFTSAPGSRTTVTLRDGTRLVLGPTTRLRVPTDFGRTTRTIDLEGEAYCAVVHDAAHPFAVRFGRVTVTDVGTQFDVQAYADDRVARVVVAEGRVMLSESGGRRVGDQPLRVGDMAMITDTGVIVTHDVDVVVLTGWMQGQVVFDGTSLATIAHDLGRAYDLDISVADSLAGRRFTGTFTNEPVDEILDVITRAVDAHYERTGRKVVIRPRSRPTNSRDPLAPVPLKIVEKA